MSRSMPTDTVDCEHVSFSHAKRESVRIDRTQIKATSGEETGHLGNVVAYEQSEFEAGLLEQATKAYNKHTQNEIQSTRQRLIDLDEDLKFAQNQIQEMEQALDKHLSDAVNSSGDLIGSRKIRSLELELELKMKNIDTLNSRKASLQKKLQLLLQENSEAPNETLLVSTSAPIKDHPQPKPSTSKTQVTSAKPDRNVAVTLAVKPKDDYHEKLERKLIKLRQAEKKCIDDANLTTFQARLRRRNQLDALERELARSCDEPVTSTPSDGDLGGNFRVPGRIWSRLFDYQRTAISWLWQLHQRQSGGIIGDEMGLGKTIEMIAFLAGLHYSEQLASQQQTGPSIGAPSMGSVLLVCPATVLQQWMCEFHEWCPAIRVAILHSSGSGYHKPANLIRTMASHSGCVLLTTYNTLVVYQDVLAHYDWFYVILDEGHKIKNPEAEITMAVKRFPTLHRIILSGSPVQNNLRELWSLFDFVCPGRLGPLPEFMQQFAIPITQGGYASASPLQVETAYRCACTLRDILMPFLIRRLKADVRLELPSKSEQVLFCRLTYYQRQLYREFTESQVCKDLLNGKGNVFTALIILRKLCNHPDLVTGGAKDILGSEATCRAREAEEGHECTDEFLSRYPWARFGCPLRSSKLLVVASLLQTWKAQGHRALVFSQSRRMLTILERLVVSLRLSYLRMDGSTPISLRQALIRQFTASACESSAQSGSPVFVFLLTTRVGGLGLNLTAANRVLIYDPDWNPTTDIQARERAWRIGQQQSVVIYRLLTSGTIEEKIYHRQIFKQFLTNRILKNPRQQRFFKTNDLQELLNFDDANSDVRDKSDQSRFTAPETAMYLHSEGLGHTVSRAAPTNRFDLLHQQCKLKAVNFESDDDIDVEDSNEDSKQTSSCSAPQPELSRQDRLRQLAKELSRRIADKTLDEEKPLFHWKSVRSSRKHRGTRVDGIRLSLVDRRSTYDTGEAEPTKKRKRLNSTTSTTSTSSVTQTESSNRDTVENIQSDVFLSALLRRDSSVPELGSAAPDSTNASSSPWEILARKRAVLDEDMREEAIRVARLAKEAIQRYSAEEKKTPSTSRSGHSISKKRRTSSASPSPSTSDPKQPSKAVDTERRSSSRDKVKRWTTPDRGVESLSLPQVSHVLAHDQLIDSLTNVNRVDTSFYRLEVHRLVVRAVDALCSEVAQRPNTIEDHSTSNVDQSNVCAPAQSPSFGLVKNRFLWNPQEKESRAYTYLLRTLEQSRLTKPAGVCKPDTSDSDDSDLGALLTGHVRFSSALLLNLIRIRRSARQSQSDTASTDPGSDPTTARMEQRIQQLAVDLIRLLCEPGRPVTTGLLAVRFKSVLADDSTDVIGAAHFRALLRHLARCCRPQTTNNSPTISRRSCDHWCLRDQFQTIGHYLSGHLAQCERSTALHRPP